MKTLIAIIAYGLFGLGSSEQGTLEVEVSNFLTYDGAVYLSVYTDEGNFLKKSIRQERIDLAQGKPVIFKLENLPHGAYSISIMQDRNLNGELDSSFGIPQEGYGFSNNARGMFGPPSFEDTQFTFDGDMKLMINLIHPPF